MLTVVRPAGMDVACVGGLRDGRERGGIAGDTGIKRCPTTVEPRQDLSYDYTQTLDDHGVLASCGSVGDAYEIALAESVVDTFKTELITDRVWRTAAPARAGARRYIGWYNHDRLHEALGDRPPVEYELAAAA